jgi:hypothetical protein
MAYGNGYFYNQLGIVQAKVTLSAAQIQAGTAIDIPEFPAVAGKYWRIISADEDFTFVTTNFTNVINIVTETAPLEQYKEVLISTSLVSVFDSMVYFGSNGSTIYIPNKKVQVQFDSASAVGDGTVILYLSAQLVTI